MVRSGGTVVCCSRCVLVEFLSVTSIAVPLFLRGRRFVQVFLIYLWLSAWFGWFCTRIVCFCCSQFDGICPGGHRVAELSRGFGGLLFVGGEPVQSWIIGILVFWPILFWKSIKGGPYCLNCS